MYRSHTCGEERDSHNYTEVTLSGWVQGVRDKGFMVYVDLRDRYGITQLYFDEEQILNLDFYTLKNKVHIVLNSLHNFLNCSFIIYYILYKNYSLSGYDNTFETY